MSDDDEAIEDEGEKDIALGNKEEEGTTAVDGCRSRPLCLPVLHQALELGDDHLGWSLLPLYCKDFVLADQNLF